MQKLTKIEQEVNNIQAEINKNKYFNWLEKTMISDERKNKCS